MSIARRADTAAIDRPVADITADDIHALMQDVSASPTHELADLIAILETLRARLLAAADSAERDLMNYAGLGHAVAELTAIAAKGAVVVQQPTIDG